MAIRSYVSQNRFKNLVFIENGASLDDEFEQNRSHRATDLAVGAIAVERHVSKRHAAINFGPAGQRAVQATLYDGGVHHSYLVTGEYDDGEPGPGKRHFCGRLMRFGGAISCRSSNMGIEGLSPRCPRSY